MRIYRTSPTPNNKMKSVFVVLATLAALAATQETELPTCAAPCLEPVVLNGSKVGDCEGRDLHCICTSQELLQNILTCLGNQKCNDTEVKITLGHAYEFCLSASVTIQTTLATPTSVTTQTTLATPTSVTHTGTSTITITAVPKPSGSPNNITNHTTTAISTTSSCCAAATGYVINGLGVAGAAVAFFLL